MRYLLIAEKPSLMKTIKAVYDKHRDVLKDDIDFVAQAGHLLTLQLPSELNPRYKKWDIEMYPEVFDYEYKVIEGKEDLVNNIKTKLNSVDAVIHAGDSDQEGQLLIDETLLYLKNKKPVYRFWSNDLTENAVLNALKSIKPNGDYSALYDAGLARQHADYQFGMNLTVIASRKFGDLYKLGRVKCAIIKILASREKAIRDFKSETTFKKAFKYTDSIALDFVCDQPYKTKEEVTLPRTATVTQVKITDKTTKPRKLFKLSTLQSEAFQKYKISANKTLEIAQILYEKQYLSYPRSNCDVLSTGINLSEILGVAVPQAKLTALKADKTYFDDKAVGEEAHTAIIPTGRTPQGLSDIEKKIYDLVYRRTLAITADDKLSKTLTVFAKDDKDFEYKTTYTWDVNSGFELVEDPTYKVPASYCGSIEYGKILNPIEPYVKECTTNPPARFNSGSLIKFMDSREIDMPNGKKMKFAIGTPATRANIIEDCIKCGYIEEKNKAYYATEKSLFLIDHTENIPLFNIKTTAEWDGMLESVRTGKAQREAVEDSLIKSMQEQSLALKAIDYQAPNKMSGKNAGTETKLLCPDCGGKVYARAVNVQGVQKKLFSCENNTKDGTCKFVLWRDYWGSDINEKDTAKLLNHETIDKKCTYQGKKYTAHLVYDFSSHKVTKAK